MRIIADISCNFQQLDDILYTIETIDAEFVKLQYYSEHDLYGTGSEETKLNIDWMPEIQLHCRKNNKKLLCTVFNPAKVRLIDPYVYAHKLASSEITDLDLIKAMRATEKMVIVSTGGATQAEIMDATKILCQTPIILLACDVEYPAKRHNIRNMLHLKSLFPNYRVGYSDHSLDIESMPILCSHYQAHIYEKHVKPNLTHPTYEQHALTVSEFNEMIQAIKGKDSRMKQNPHKRVYNDELKRWVRPRV